MLIFSSSFCSLHCVVLSAASGWLRDACCSFLSGQLMSVWLHGNTVAAGGARTSADVAFRCSVTSSLHAQPVTKTRSTKCRTVRFSSEPAAPHSRPHPDEIPGCFHLFLVPSFTPEFVSRQKVEISSRLALDSCFLPIISERNWINRRRWAFTKEPCKNTEWDAQIVA